MTLLENSLKTAIFPTNSSEHAQRMTDDESIDKSTGQPEPDPNHGKKGRGNLWIPTAEQRRQVKLLAAMGTPQEDIALVIGVSKPTLRRACKAELRIGLIEADVKVTQSLFRMATHETHPNVAAAIFWKKARSGWSDRPDALTGESPAKKQERREKAGQIAGAGKFKPGAPPKLKVVK